ncbi:centromere-associated protein E isoform X3 [Anolis sagrei]|uniref:centromere-associated protein E isoform X3 n=1 Tax=Anolis sagrei TaxID=38937 RepID=UPI00351FE1B7
MAEEGGVTVCVRVRPLIARENEDLDDKVQLAWKSEESTVSQTDGTKSFTFDRVFHSEDSTAEVYQGVAAPIIKSAVQGYNGTIFAYGQTASGKTYTILGTPNCPGILPMAINDVFNTICRIPNREFLLRISYMEIHNETVQDLLCSNIKKKRPLVVREDINRNIFVEDLIEEVVISPEQVLSWLQKGEKNRHYGETKMNDRSSRSHTIFRMIIESKEKDTASSSYEGAVMVSHLNLVDLAGSERASQTGTEGIRFKEGCNINRSLFILGQVIKKLCDDQSGSGFINYRDSKLTRILQSSLGGNAKTVIICTITPASLEETLSTLQFASTAKNMKNTPKVNEVLDDEALLKRYRKEIENLKRRLEEVSTHSHTKDELAQLLEEKDSLQKQQEDRIRALTEMLVTASSFSQELEAKAKRKRRVTWAPGAISKEAGVCFLEDLPSREKRSKFSLPALSEMEESMSSVLSEGDNLRIAAASVVQPKEEWIPASEINFTAGDLVESDQLCETILEERDNAVFEQKVMKRKLKNLEMENDQLRYELRELKEKQSNEEFEALENETAKEHEDEIKSKELQLKEQESKIKVLENKVAEQRNLMADLNAQNENGDMSTSIISNKGMDEMQQVKQSLNDAETVLLDAKRESAFLRSENISLKEKTAQLLETSSQMEKDLECFRRQLEAGKVMYKRMQTDLQKELQYYFQENAKLMSLLEDKVPKDLLSRIELERKIEDLKNELNKTQEQNTDLRKEVTELSEAASGHDLEILQKEILEKSEIIASLSCEREGLLSQIAEKDRLLQEATDALKSEKDFANAEVMTEEDVAFQELKHQHDELSQKFIIASEESTQMKSKVDLLSGENLELNKAVSNLTQELSSKIKELQENNLEQKEFFSVKVQLEEAHQKLNEMEQLKDQLKAWESKMEIAETERQAITRILDNSKEEITALTQERDDLKQKQEALKQERDQIQADIEETVSMNIEVQEELRKAHDSLRQYQDHIKELEETIAARDRELSAVKESLGTTIEEQKQQLAEQLSLHISEKERWAAELRHQTERAQQITKESSLFQEKGDKLLQDLQSLRAENDQLRESMLENTAKLSLKIQELQDKEKKLEELRGLKQELSESQWEHNGLDQLYEELKAEKMEKLEMTQRLGDSEAERDALTQERDDWRKKWEAEREAFRELEKETSLMMQKLQEECLQLKQSLELKEEQRQKDEERLKEVERLKATIESKMEAMEKEKAELAQKLDTTLEDMRSVTMEKETLKITLEGLQADKNCMIQTLRNLSETVDKTVSSNLQLQEQLQRAHNAVEEHTKTVAELKAEIMDKDSWTSKLQETLKQETETERESLQAQIQQQEEKINSLKKVIDEKTHLHQKLESKYLEENEQLRKTNVQLQEQLQCAHNAIEEHTKTVAELKAEIMDKDAWASKLQETLKQETETEMESLQAQIQQQEEKINSMKKVIDEKTHLHQNMESKYVEENEQLRKKTEAEMESLQAQIQQQEEKINSMKKVNDEKTHLHQKLESKYLEETEQLRKKFPETSVHEVQQDFIKSLDAKILRIKEVQKTFSCLEERSNCLKAASLQIQCAFNHQKSVISKGLADLSPQQAKDVKWLQIEHEDITNSLYSLLNKLQFHFTRLCRKRAQYYTKVSTYTSELLEERRKQLELLTQIQHLKKCSLDQPTPVSHQLNLPELSQYLDLYTEQILKDISEMEEELGDIEQKLKQLQNCDNESKQYFERCSVHFNVQDFEAGIKQEKERFMPVGKFLNPKTQACVQARLALDTRITDYCKETEDAFKACREQTKELLLELNTLKEEEKLREKQNHSYDAALAQIEKNHKLEKELKAAEEDRKNLKLKVQELENRGSEAEISLQEKEKRIAILQSELNVRTSKSEVPKLKAALEEKENCLRSALKEMETLKTKLSKGAEFYKEENEDLKTKLVNADMARTKQSRIFDQEMANAKALIEHKEQQLRKLKEDLRKMQQDQDTTVAVLSSKDLPQPPQPITYGGGSGIVQNTHLLMLKSEHAKLEKKYSQLQQEHEVVLANMVGLKEDVKKWKERALKTRAHLPRDVHEEQIPKSPKKTAPPLNAALPSSPSWKQILNPVLPPNTPTAAPSDGFSFFSDPCQENLTDSRSTTAESIEHNLKYWLDKDAASNCKTQ